MPSYNARGEIVGPPVKVSISTRGGPGTELKALLTRIHIFPNECGCSAMAAEMDREGPEWCRKHAGRVLDQMEAEAKKRGLPFVPWVAEWLLEFAIKRAEAKAKS